MSIDLKKLTLVKAVEALSREDFSARDLTESYLEAITDNNPALNAYLEIFDTALDEAKMIDHRRKAGDKLHSLAGIPLAIKDNILIKGKTVSSASLMLKDYRAIYDATVIKKLKVAGAIFLGRTNMDEFAMGGSTENSAFGPTKNPHDQTRVPGGSSGGSASAVGGNLALAALGSDTGGSIRQPSSFCGVVGLKPTYGAVSRYGLMAMASSLDQIGPIAKTVADAEIIYHSIVGHDPLDSTSVFSQELFLKPKPKMTIGVPRHFLSEGVDASVMEVFDQTIKKLTDLGHQVCDIELPNINYSLACYYIIMPAEVSTNLARFDGLRFGTYKSGDTLLQDYLKTRGENFGPEVRRRIILGTYVLSAGYYDAYYSKAVSVQKLIKDDYRRVFEGESGVKVDAILTPTAPSPAFPLGEKTSDPLKMYLEDIFTVPVNLAGLPAISVPAGHTSSGLPIGVQLTGPRFGEEILFALGKQIEDESTYV